MEKVFLNEILKNNRLIIKEVKGIENLQSIETGAMITCNHFNPFDSLLLKKFLEAQNNQKVKNYIK